MVLSVHQNLKAQGVGSFPSFSAQSDSTTEISSCTPWQYCRIYWLDFPTSSTIAGVRGAAGERHRAMAKSIVHTYNNLNTVRSPNGGDPSYIRVCALRPQQ